MRILLIYPHAPPISPLWMPLGLSFVAAALRKAGHEAAIFDRYAVGARSRHDTAYVDTAMLSRIREFRPDVVGLNTLSPLIADTVESAPLIRDSFGGRIIAGGHHATALPELTLRRIPSLDAVVTGEGEIALTRLAGGEAPGQVPGVWWRAGERINPPAAPAEQIKRLDDLPLPALDLLDMPFYTRRSDGVIRRNNVKASTLVTSRGCYQQCTFCTESLTYGRGVRWHGTDYVLEWILRVVRDYGVEGIYFHDNDFLASEARAREVCGELIRRGLHRRIRWSIQARADRITRDLARLLRSAGCVLVEFGVEVATQAELDDIAKGTSPGTVERAIRLCRKSGMDVHAYMLTQVENETTADLARRLAWLKRMPVTSFQWSAVNVHPGTVLYRRKGDDFFARHDWTRETIAAYYAGDRLSAISPGRRRAWMARHFSRYLRLHWFLNAPGRYPLPVIVRVATRMLRRKILRARRAIPVDDPRNEVLAG